MMKLSLEKIATLVLLLLAANTHARPARTRGARAVSMTQKRHAAIGALGSEHDRLAHAAARLLAKQDTTNKGTVPPATEVQAAMEAPTTAQAVAQAGGKQQDVKPTATPPDAPTAAQNGKQQDVNPTNAPPETPTAAQNGKQQDVKPSASTPEAPTQAEPAATEAGTPSATDEVQQVEASLEANATNATEPTMTEKGAAYVVDLAPFKLQVDGPVVENNLDLEGYLEAYLKDMFPNLVNVTLTAELVDIPEEEPMVNVTTNVTMEGNMTIEANMTGNATEVEENLSIMDENSTRYLRGSDIYHRGLKQVIYVTGTATFMGDGKELVNATQVVAAQAEALQDTKALETYFKETTPEYGDLVVEGVTVGDNATIPPATEAPTSSEASSTSSGGLSTVGLTIVIVAACVGGISLLIIVIVGFSNPAANVKKRGLPEQPLQ